MYQAKGPKSTGDLPAPATAARQASAGGRRGRCPQADRPLRPGGAAAPGPGRRSRHRAASRVADRAGPRRRGRVSRPGQRREQHDRRRDLRVSARLDRGARQRHGLAHPVPLGEARGRHGREPAGGARPPHPEPLGPPRLLGAGGARRHGDRHRRGDRRRGRAQPAVPGAAALGRPHHRCRVDGAARAAVAAGSAHVRVRGDRAHGHHRHRIHRRGLRRAARSRRCRRRARAPVRGRRFGAARGIHPRRHDHAARDLRAQRPRARPLRSRGRPRRAGDSAPLVASCGIQAREATRSDHRAARRPNRPRAPASRRRISRAHEVSRPPACCARRDGMSRSP